MNDATLVLLGISIILFMGFLGEWVFKKTKIPDVLILIIIGFVIGPFGLKYVNPTSIAGYAPIFTTFALLFLLYDGAFNIDLKSLVKGALPSFKITIFNFLLSAFLISLIMVIIGYDILLSILTGFILGGISSAFVIPLLRQLKPKPETYSILMLESAITDVLCIVFAFAILEIITIQSFNLYDIIKNIVFLFVFAGITGSIAGLIWIVIVATVFKEQKPYMITIAYLILLYVITEFIGGNGAIAALFFGLILKNSKKITQYINNYLHVKPKYMIHATTPSEKFFDDQLSFFLKIFFFVYIGMLFDISDIMILLIGFSIAVAIMIGRRFTKFVTQDFDKQDQNLIGSVFARGLAAAAIAQVVLSSGIEGAESVVAITYSVIVFSIILSSISIFVSVRKKHRSV